MTICEDLASSVERLTREVELQEKRLKEAEADVVLLKKLWKDGALAGAIADEKKMQEARRS